MAVLGSGTTALVAVDYPVFRAASYPFGSLAPVSMLAGAYAFVGRDRPHWIRAGADATASNVEAFEQRISQITEHGRDFLAEFDEQGTILYLSPIAGPLLGIELDTLIGRNLMEFSDGIKSAPPHSLAQSARSHRQGVHSKCSARAALIHTSGWLAALF